MPVTDQSVIENLAARPALHCNFKQASRVVSAGGDSCQFTLPRISAVMDEPASFAHLARVIEASVVVTPHGRGHKGKNTALHLKRQHL